MTESEKRRPQSEDKPVQRPPQPSEVGAQKPRPKEIGGPKGLEPTRYGDWEFKGRCIDF